MSTKVINIIPTQQHDKEDVKLIKKQEPNNPKPEQQQHL
jgi:hypothetical protein